jgi:pyruvate dehydrogenase E2 component (dihydrolipoamide acetyltransferase)/2-oxoisovalerate dehydrogenase E2 component (dihydrolipoyl transacylase)
MEFRLPELGEGVYEAELVRWLVSPGTAVKRGQNLLEAMTDKATMEVPSPFAGTVTDLRAEPGQTIKVGDVILTYEGAKTEAASSSRVEERREPVQAVASAPRRECNGPPATGMSVKAAPSVRYMAREMGIDLARVHGTGPGGRILVADLAGQVQAPASPRKPAEKKPDYGTPGTRVKLLGLRRKIADHMVMSKRIIPHYSYVDECDVSEMVRLRQGLKEAGTAGVKITYLAFFVKAVAAALKEVPIVNASLDDAAGEIVLHNRYDIGVATATDAGLVVPVVREVDRKNLFEIAHEIERLSSAARSGRAKPEELRGSTFTVTSIGNVGGLISTPVINHPEVGILGIGKVVKRPVCDSAGNIRPADLVYLSFSFDHRVVDGAVGAMFGNAVLGQLQNPVGMLIPDKR